MAKTLQQILGFTTLTGIITSPLAGVPKTFDENFYSLTTPITGQFATTYVVENTRRNTPGVNYGSQSRKITPPSVSALQSRCVHTFSHIDHNAATLVALRNMDDQRAQIAGQQIVEAQTAEFRRMLDNNRISAVASMLRYGEIYYNGQGDLLHSSSGATQTVSLGVPAANKDQLGGNIAASWATAGTDILGQLANIQKTAVQTTGLPLTRCYYGSGVINSLLGNNAIKELMKSDTALTSALRQNRIPEGFGLSGMRWEPLWTSHFRDSSGTAREWFPSDFVVFTPEVTRDWYEMQEGSYPVPTSIGNVSADGVAAVNDLEYVNGMFSYAHAISDPVGVRHFMGDTFLPVLRQPNAIYIADTQF